MPQFISHPALCLLASCLLLLAATAAQAQGPIPETRMLCASADTVIVHAIDFPEPSRQNQHIEVGTTGGIRKSGDNLGYSRVLLRFDLTEVPKNAKVISARLRLRRAYQKEEGAGNVDNTITVKAYRLLRPWNEGGEQGATWLYAKRKQARWTKPGADATPEAHKDKADRAAEPTASVNALDFSTGVFNFWDVMQDVQEMLVGTQENHGWILIGPEVLEGDDWVRYWSREGAASKENPEACPMLLLTYVVEQ